MITAAEVSANEVGYLVSEEFQKAAARSGYSAAPWRMKSPGDVFSVAQ